MNIESKALSTNLAIVAALLLLFACAHYLSLRNQISHDGRQLQQSINLLLDNDLLLTETSRANAIRALPAVVDAHIVDNLGNSVGSNEGMVPHSKPNPFWTLLGLGGPVIQTFGAGLDVRVTLDVSALHARATNLWLALIAIWAVVIVISQLWLRSWVNRPLRMAVAEVSRLLERIMRREGGELRLGQEIAQEFRTLADGLNRLQQDLLGRLQETENQLNHLRQLAFTDQLTELPNRARFNEDLQQASHDNHGREYGHIGLLRTKVLAQLNREYGYSHGDNFIRAVVAALRSILSRYPRARAYRLNSSDFAVIMSQMASHEAEELARALMGRLEEVSITYHVQRCAVLGIIPFGPQRSVSELLALVDTAAGCADNNSHGFLLRDETEQREGIGEQRWRDEIDHILADRKVSLLKRNIIGLRDIRSVREILPRFVDRDNQDLSTQALYAMAERLGRAEALDQLVIEQVIGSLRHSNDNVATLVPLSGYSMHSAPFVAQLERLLGRDRQIANQLIFAVSESALARDPGAASRFVETIHRTGSRLLVDAFGHGITSFLFFRDLKPDYVRLAADFTLDAEQDKNIQYFVRLLVDVCHRVNAKVVANGITAQGQRYVLEGLAVDLLCGELLSPTQPLLIGSDSNQPGTSRIPS